MQQTDRQRTTLLIAGLSILLLLALSVWSWTGVGGLPEDVGVGEGTATSFAGESVAVGEEVRAPEAELAREVVTAKPSEVATTGSMRIELKYADGGPGADLLLLILDAGVSLDSPATPRLEGRSDLDGVYVQEDLAPGSYQVMVVQPIASENPIEIVAGEETSVAIEFAEGYSISGIVVDRQDRPVAGASIWAGRSLWSVEPSIRSDRAGRFHLRGIKSQTMFSATAAGYGPSRTRYLDANPGAELEIQLVLQGAGGAVQGRVISHDGNALAGALVVFINQAILGNDAQGSSLSRLQVLSDERGEFRVEGLSPTKIEVLAQAKGHGGIKESVEVIAGGVVQILLQLKQDSRLHGRVLDGAGQPIADARVMAISQSEGSGSAVRTTSGTDGSYRLSGLISGRTWLIVQTDTKFNEEYVSLEAGADLEHDIRFPSGMTIEGKVLNSLGDGLADWMVMARGPGQDYDVSKCDAEGRFVLVGLTPGQAYSLLFMRSGQVYVPCYEVAGIMAGSSDLEFRIPDEAMAYGSVRGRIIDWQGKVAVGRLILVTQIGSRYGSQAVLKENGEFHIKWLPQGRYSVRMLSGDSSQFLPEFDLGPWEDLDLGELREEQSGSLSLSLSIPQGMGVERLTFYDRDRRAVGGVNLEDGRLEKFAMGPGTHYLRVRGTGVSSQMHEFSITPGQETSLSLDLKSASTVALTFTIDSSSIKPGKVIDLQVFDAARQLFSREPLAYQKDGFHHRGFFPPGTYSFTARYGDSLASEGEFEVEVGTVGETSHSFALR